MSTKTKSLSALAHTFSIYEIEKTLIYNFIQENDIDCSQSCYISNYLSGFTPNTKLLNSIAALNHSRIEEIAVDMELLMPAEDKKTNGAFFTPEYIVDYIISSLAPQENAKIIDPSCGSGAFLIGIIRYFINRYNKSVYNTVKENIFGADILEYNIRRSKLLIVLFAAMRGENVSENDIHIYTTDSLRHEWTHQFDYVVGNPPYVKFQDLDETERSFLFENYQTTKTGTYNLYFAFFELGLRLLNNEGKLGYISPNNYFTSLSGETLRRFFQTNKSIYQIIDFDATKVFEVQTYTAITFLSKKENNCILYDRIERGETPSAFLSNITLTPNKYNDLSTKKWRLLCTDERENIQTIENCGQALGNLMNICVGIATLKDELYFIDIVSENDKYYYAQKKSATLKIEKEITRPLVKISDIKSASDINNNKRRIIFPYKNLKGKAVPIEEDELKEKYPFCYEYLLSVKDILDKRNKGKCKFSPFYAYGRTQGLNRFGPRIYTPTFSAKPRFIFDAEEDVFFTNGYGLYFKENGLWSNPLTQEGNVDVLLKIINSCVMDYYVTKTSVSIEGGYPCYQKNFIERFSIPQITENQISCLRGLTDPNDIDRFVCELYQINVRQTEKAAKRRFSDKNRAVRHRNSY